MVEHGVTGFLAGTSSEWVEYLERLAKDPILRQQMSSNAAQVAREKYSLESHKNKIIDAFQVAVS